MKLTPIVSLSLEQRIVVAFTDEFGRKPERARLEALGGQHVVDLVRAPHEWSWLKWLAETGRIDLDSNLRLTVDELLLFRGLAPPLRPVPLKQQLGYLLEASTVVAKKDVFSVGTYKGSSYRCTAAAVPHKWTELRETVKDGKLVEDVVILRQNRLLVSVFIQGSAPWTWLEGRDDPSVFLDLFEFNAKLAVQDAFPGRYEAALRAVKSVEADFGFRLRDWQRDDVATAVCVGRSLLALEPGLGKTISTMVVAEALRRFHSGARVPLLVVAPQDLMRQWQREAYKFFRRSFTRVDSVDAALVSHYQHKEGKTLKRPSLIASEVRHAVRNGSNGWFLTHYEVVSRTGRREHTTEDGERLLFAKAAGSTLSTVFSNGMIAIDEITKIKGAETDVSLAVRGLRARYRLGLSGTPVRNTLPDIFWLLWWIGGNRTALFPYAYSDGLKALQRDFGTTERVSVAASFRQVPEPGNAQALRRLLAPLVIRRTVASLPEPPQPVKFISVRCPWGTRQREQYQNWLDPVRFAEYWQRKYPSVDALEEETVKKHGAVLGQLVHLDYATTVPESEPDRDNDPVGGPSNWTPKALRSLQVIREHVRHGERVLFGSGFLGHVAWMTEQLAALGIRAVGLTTPTGKDNRPVSLGPEPRQDAVEEFLYDGGQVLCAGLQSLALGHDLHQVSTVVVSGLPWDLMTLEQFLARVRRLTSPRPISVYVMLTVGSLDDRKWDLLERKRRAAQDVFQDPVSLLRDEGAPDLEGLLAQIRFDAPQLAEQPAESEDSQHLVFRAMQREPFEMPSKQMGLDTTLLQQHPPSANYTAVFSVAAALTSGYVIPSSLGYRAQPTPVPGLSALTYRGQLLGTGSAADVAAAFCAHLRDAVEVERALRLARMPEEERQRHLGWWHGGPYSWPVATAEEKWWLAGPYTWRLGGGD